MYLKANLRFKRLKHLWLCSCCLMMYNLVAAQSIKWQADVLLTFDDFKSKPKPADKTQAALTASTMVFSYKSNGKTIQFEMYSLFDQNNSWFVEEAKTPAILMHEQMHFNITEWHVRLLRQQLSNMHLSNHYNFANSISKVYKAVQQQCAQMQKKYDKETNHGLDENMQMMWQAKVADALSELAQFDNEKFEMVID